MKAPAIITPGWDYICFTDDPALRSDVWDVRLSPRSIADRELEEKKFAIKHMILFHQYLEGYDLSLSVGAQVKLNCNLDDLMRDHFQAGDDMMICIHPERDCVYEEARVCKDLKLDDPRAIDAQMTRYQMARYPRQNGLYATGVFARRHDRPNLRSMCEFWWEEYRQGSRRDQLSLNYAIWKSPPINISALQYDRQFAVRGNFSLHPHKRRIRFDGTRMTMRGSHAEITYSPQSTLALTDHPRYVAYLDLISPDVIAGWAADRDRLDASVKVSIYDDDLFLESVSANELRPDTGAYLGDSGLHGFNIAVPLTLLDGASHTVNIRFDDYESIVLQICDFILQETWP